MKITKDYLKKIIKEQLENENLLEPSTNFQAAASHILDLKRMIQNKYLALQKKTNGNVTAEQVSDMFVEFYKLLDRLSKRKEQRSK